MKETNQKLKMTNPNRCAYQDREYYKLSGSKRKLSKVLKKYQMEREFSKKLKQASKEQGDARVMNYLEKFHNVSIASYDSMDAGIAYNFSCIAYLYEQAGVKYAVDIQTGKNYRVADGSGFGLTKEEYNYVVAGEAIAYDMGNINYELYHKYNSSYDEVAKSAMKYDMTSLEDIVADIKQFIVVTNGFQELDSDYVRDNLSTLSNQKVKK